MTDHICGMDEAGRGAMAGPLIAAAVIFPPAFDFAQAFRAHKMRDSKKLSERQREALYQVIHDHAMRVAVESCLVDEINEMGMGYANRAVFERLIIAMEADRYIVDGNLKLADLGAKQRRTQSLVRGDEKEPAIAAASIIAKVTRDRLMHALHSNFPVYGWDHNQGYPTQVHIKAVMEYGMCEHHRRKYVATAVTNANRRLLPIDWED